MNYILFDNESWEHLLPLTYTRPVSEIRAGIITIKDKWEKLLNTKISNLTREYLSEKYPVNVDSENTLIAANLIPDKELVEAIQKLKTNQALVQNDKLLSVRLNKDGIAEFNYNKLENFDLVGFKKELITIEKPWDIFRLNETNIQSDFELLTKDRKTKNLSSTNNIIGLENIFVEDGAKVEFATLNASAGPIYIGKDVEIMEGSIIRGPFAIGEHSVVKMAAKIYGSTTIGPHSKVGGEIKNTAIQGYSSKAHDGFLGDSVIGEWCNLGADTNNSNLKNNYAEVRLWSYAEGKFISTGLQFCGLIMGDHSKCGINTMFNTGTVVGVSANIFGEGFPRNFIPSFAWGGASGFKEYKLDKAFEVAELVMKRREKEFDAAEQKILEKIYTQSARYRKFH